MKMLLDPINQALEEQQPGTWRAFNPENLKSAISEEASRIRDTIREKVRGRLVSIKLDIATLRCARSMLGVNIQFCKSGRLVLRNLAVEEMFERHTGLNIRKEVLRVLQRYGIAASQIYSATTDNASNMLKFTADMDAAAIADGAPPPPPLWVNDEAKVDEDDDVNDEVTLAEPTDSSENIPEWAEPIAYVSTNTAVVNNKRCAAHTLQLAVSDALKTDVTATELIKKARTLCTKLRVQSLSEVYKRLKKRRPSLDCETRSNSMLIMVLDLLDLEENMETVIAQNEKLACFNLSDAEWTALRDIARALTPAKEATIKLQSVQLVEGDFVRIWFKCKLSTKQAGTPLALALVQAMEVRQEALLSSLPA